MPRPYWDSQFAETISEKNERLRKARQKRAERQPVTITVLVPSGGKIVKVLGEDASGTPLVLEIK